MGYRLNRLDEPVFMAGPNPMLTELDIHHRLESCESNLMTHVIVPEIYDLSVEAGFYGCDLTHP